MHKTANILNKVALSVQTNMKKDLREVYLAPNRASAEVTIDVFAEKYAAKCDKAVECVTKARDAMLALYDFPAEHWDHLRTTNPIESVFATIRHRTVRTKGSLSSTTARLMVFKPLGAASKTWRRLKGTNQLPKVIAGVRFENGSEVIDVRANHAACSPRHPNSTIARSRVGWIVGFARQQAFGRTPHSKQPHPLSIAICSNYLLSVLHPC